MSVHRSLVIFPIVLFVIVAAAIVGIFRRDDPSLKNVVLERPEGEQQMVEDSTLSHSDKGRLYVYIMRDPDPLGFPRALSNGDHFKSFLTGIEWEALFCDVLRACSTLSDSVAISVDSQEQRSTRFVEALPDYPLLARISDMYIYVAYKAEEIQQLRNECLKIEHSTADKRALRWLTKLSEACEDALNVRSGLLLVPD